MDSESNFGSFARSKTLTPYCSIGLTVALGYGRVFSFLDWSSTSSISPL
jgi:hypothetical protein